MVKKMFIKVRYVSNDTCFERAYQNSENIRGEVNVSILNKLKIMFFFFVNTKQMRKHNVIFNKTVTKIVIILTKCFFSIPEPYKLP